MQQIGLEEAFETHASYGSIYIAEQPYEIEDWDAHIEKPPAPKVKGKIKARFKYIGRSKPWVKPRKHELNS